MKNCSKLCIETLKESSFLSENLKVVMTHYYNKIFTNWVTLYLLENTKSSVLCTPS